MKYWGETFQGLEGWTVHSFTYDDSLARQGIDMDATTLQDERIILISDFTDGMVDGTSPRPFTKTERFAVRVSTLVHELIHAKLGKSEGEGFMHSERFFEEFRILKANGWIPYRDEKSIREADARRLERQNPSVLARNDSQK